MRKLITVCIVLALVMLSFAGCQTGSPAESGSASESVSAEQSTGAASGSAEGASAGKVTTGVFIIDTTDPYLNSIGQAIQTAFQDAGAESQVFDGNGKVATQIEQIQNAVTQGVDIIYVFPLGGGNAYHDALVNAREAGVRVLVSNNFPGEGAYDVFVGSDQLEMGAMDAKMVSNWIDSASPDSANVKALLLEANLNNEMISRCLGMRLIGEKFLRVADVGDMRWMKTEGDPVDYMDENGDVKPVDEPTGGLILDDQGYAILNPFYDPRVELIEVPNRTMIGLVAADAQAALDSEITLGNDDIQVVMSYGDIGIPMSTKMMELVNAGRLTNDLSHVAAFGADVTEQNKEAIKSSLDNTSVFRGVMAAGDLLGTVCEYAAKMVADESVTANVMMPLSYVTVGSDGEIMEVKYDDLPEEEKLPIDVSQFFPAE